MAEATQESLSALTKAQHELAESQTHVVELEALQEVQRQQAELAFNQYAQRMEILHKIDVGIIEATTIPEVIEVALKTFGSSFSASKPQ